MEPEGLLRIRFTLQLMELRSLAGIGSGLAAEGNSGIKQLVVLDHFLELGVQLLGDGHELLEALLGNLVVLHTVVGQ